MKFYQKALVLLSVCSTVCVSGIAHAGPAKAASQRQLALCNAQVVTKLLSSLNVAFTAETIAYLVSENLYSQKTYSMELNSISLEYGPTLNNYGLRTIIERQLASLSAYGVKLNSEKVMSDLKEKVLAETTDEVCLDIARNSNWF